MENVESFSANAERSNPPQNVTFAMTDAVLPVSPLVLTNAKIHVLFSVYFKTADDHKISLKGKQKNCISQHIHPGHITSTLLYYTKAVLQYMDKKSTLRVHLLR